MNQNCCSSIFMCLLTSITLFHSPPLSSGLSCVPVLPPRRGSFYVESGTGVSVGSVLAFWCREGYQLVGSDKIYCNVRNGKPQWSNYLPVCEGKRVWAGSFGKSSRFSAWLCNYSCSKWTILLSELFSSQQLQFSPAFSMSHSIPTLGLVLFSHILLCMKRGCGLHVKHCWCTAPYHAQGTCLTFPLKT